MTSDNGYRIAKVICYGGSLFRRHLKSKSPFRAFLNFPTLQPYDYVVFVALSILFGESGSCNGKRSGGEQTVVEAKVE